MAVKDSKIGEHECCILMQLYDKVTLTSSHMLKLCFPNRTISSVYKVLSGLKSQGLIEAAIYDLGRRGKLENVHTLTHKGWKFLCSNNVLDEEDCPFLLKRAPLMIADYAHRMGIIDYWINLELDIQREVKFELSLFVPEFKRLENGNGITLKYRTELGAQWQIRNDALFVITNIVTEQEYLFLLEIDRGTIPTSMAKTKALPLQMPIARNYLDSKLIKIQKILSVSEQVFPSLGNRFAHFCGARVVVITSSAKRIVNIIHSVPIHEELVKQQVFMFSYFGEVDSGAFRCRYAVPILRGSSKVIETKPLLTDV
jgi:hypothetical protein